MKVETVTFLFTDIEGSTRLLAHLGDRYADVLASCLRILNSATKQHGGWDCGTQGDAFHAAFHRAEEAFAAALSAQYRLAEHPWPDGAAVRVRMGVHTGDVIATESGYVGMEAHRAARICAAAYGGQILLSEAVRSLVLQGLPAGVMLREAGTHRLKDLPGTHHLFQAVADGLPAEFPPLRTLDSLPNNLPHALTSFIGRERETAEIKASLSTARLVTLTGAGGAGKTRLAIHVAAELLDRYPDGVWVAELGALSDAAMVPTTVASAVGVPEYPGRPLISTLVERLEAASVLLLLDNCEHLLDACPAFAETLLRRCRNLRILATSREGLGVAGEVSHRVPPLSLPRAQARPAPDDLLRYDAVRLFVERAAASTPQFRLTPKNARATADVCIRLDGIPLALELAAARVKALTVEQIAARLDRRFHLLVGGSRTAPPRHQTLRAVIDWSYDLLSPAEQALLRRLSVFAGGFTLEAAEAVCSGARAVKREIFDVLARLVDKSLVNMEPAGGQACYRMLESVRQYGQERLGRKEADTLRRRHRAWFRQLAEHASEAAHGADQRRWFDRLEAEHDNLRAALAWKSLDAQDAEQRLRLAAALIEFWDSRTHWDEGRTWLDAVLADGPQAPSFARANTLARTGFMAYRHGELDRALALYKDSLAMAATLRNQRLIHQALLGCGFVKTAQGDVDAAIPALEEALDLAAEISDGWKLGTTLGQLGTALWIKGECRPALVYCEQAVEVLRAIGSKRDIAHALRLAGHAARSLGEASRAVELYIESLALFAETKDKWVAAECLIGLGLIGLARGDHAQAARLLGAVEAARARFSIGTSTIERGEHVRVDVATLMREGSYGEAFAAAWAEGRMLTLPQAIGEAARAAHVAETLRVTPQA